MMVPRPEVVGISVEMPPEEALRAVLESPFTRYPVFRESLDDVVGILHVRDLVSALHDTAIAEVELEELLRPAYVVPETKDLAALLGGVPPHEPAHGDRRRRVRGDAGDRHARGPARGDRRRDRGRVRPARTSPSSASTRRRSGSTARSRSTTSTSSSGRRSSTRTTTRSPGYVFDLLGRAAEPGDEVRSDGLRFTVLEVEGSRIQRLEVEFLAARAGARRERRRRGRRGGVASPSRSRTSELAAPLPRLHPLPRRHGRDGARGRDVVRRDRVAGLRDPQQPARPRPRRARDVHPAAAAGAARPGTSPTASRAARCSRSRPRSTRP